MIRGFLPKKARRTRGGANVPHNKNTAAKAGEQLPCPERVVVPMAQHIGAPCKPVVKPGNAVAVGDIIGESVSGIGSPIHAPISGTVVKVHPQRLADGRTVDAVEIRSDGVMRQSKRIKKPVIGNTEEFLEAVRASGLVGLGGAGFPTHVKLDVPDGKHVDTLLINCAECEPYITADNRAAVEDTEDIMRGILAVMKYLEIGRAIIGVEKNKPDAIKALTDAINKAGESERVCVLKLPARYPQGDEKVLIKACTGRTVAHGMLPKDVGCIVMNISSTAFLGSYLETGMPLVSKRVTVDGSAVKEPKNLIVPIGTLVCDILEYCGVSEPIGKLMYGGPMMGIALATDRSPILKQNNAVLAFSRGDALLPEPTACIRCGRCAAHCPMHLVPEAIEKAVKLRSPEMLEKYGVSSCIECGSCAYGCPAHRPLVQSIRVGKTILKEAHSHGT